jgi:hypothetical protein
MESPPMVEINRFFFVTRNEHPTRRGIHLPFKTSHSSTASTYLLPPFYFSLFTFISGIVAHNKPLTTIRFQLPAFTFHGIIMREAL